MRLLTGLAITLLGFYFLSKNIIFTTKYLYFFWEDASATSAVLCIAGGTAAIIFLSEKIAKFGWILIFIGIVCVFVNARIFIRPTSLWTFFVGFAAMLAGFKIMTGFEDD